FLACRKRSLWTFIAWKRERASGELLAPRLSNRSLIHNQAETWSLGQRDITIDRLQDIGAQTRTDFLERKEVFGDDEVLHASGRMHGRGQGESCWVVIVRRNGDRLARGGGREV